MVETDVGLSVSSIGSLIEQLCKAFRELESQKDFAVDKVQLREAEEHFRHLETLILNKFLEIEIREKAFKEEESDNLMLIASKEADVAAKEQDLLDRIQELKDTAFAAIAEARANHPLAAFESVDVGGSKNSQVSSSLGGKIALVYGNEVKRFKKLHKTVGKDEGMPGEVRPRPELIQLCEQMDAKGLLNFVVDNQYTIPSICEELTLALGSATEPGHLVLASLEGNYLPDETGQEGNKNDAALHGTRNSCLIIIKAMATLLAKADPSADNLLSPEIKQQAKAIADEWKPKLAGTGMDAANANSVEAEAFLQLLATFRIASEFDEDELCKHVLAVAHVWQGPELCRSLGLTHKMPGLVEALIKSGKRIEAARFIHDFRLTESFPLVPLLKAYLKDLRRNSQGKNDANTQELAALGAVVRCVEDYKLEADYPLDPLRRRVDQLENSKRHTKSSRHQPSKKLRANGESYEFHAPAVPPSRQAASPFGGRASFHEIPVRYPTAGPSPYDYQAPNLPTYPQQAYDQRYYCYAQDDRGTAATSNASSSNYGRCTPSGMQSATQPYM